MGLGPGGGGGVSSVQCPVSSVQDEEQNQEYEENGRRRKLEEETRRGNPIDNRPSTSTGWFFMQPLEQEKVAVMCCKGTCRR